MRSGQAPYYFLLPAFVLLGLFSLAPIVHLVIVSLGDWDVLTGSYRFVGLENYRDVIASDAFRRSVVVTAYYLAVTVPVGTGVALGLALLLTGPGRVDKAVRAVVFTPVVTSSVATGLVFSDLLDPGRGAVNRLLSTFGFGPFPFLSSEALAMPSVIVWALWKQIGYSMVLFLNGLGSIPAAYYDAAALDGARPGWQTFRHVTWPLLMPTTLFVLGASTVLGLRAFESSYVLTRGGPAGATTTVVYFVSDRAFRGSDFGGAASASVLLLAAVLAVVGTFYGARSCVRRGTA